MKKKTTPLQQILNRVKHREEISDVNSCERKDTDIRHVRLLRDTVEAHIKIAVNLCDKRASSLPADRPGMKCLLKRFLVVLGTVLVLVSDKIIIIITIITGKTSLCIQVSYASGHATSPPAFANVKADEVCLS